MPDLSRFAPPRWGGIRYLKPHRGPEMLVWVAGILAAIGAAAAYAFLYGAVMDPAVARSFAATVLGFETAVVAIAIPTALNVVGRLYEKYASNRMRDALMKGLPLIRLALVAFPTIVLLLVMISGVIPSGAFTEALAIIGCLVTVAFFFLFMDTVVHFVVNEPFAAVEFMTDRLRTELASGEDDLASRDGYVTAVQGIGDILAYAAFQGTQDGTVDTCLAALAIPVDALLELRDGDRDAYLRAAVRAAIRATGPERVEESLAFYPAATLAGLVLPVEQVVRGFRRAAAGGNDEAGRRCLDWVADALGRVAAEPGHEPEALALLVQFRDMTEHALAARRPALVSASAHGWFFRLLFPGPARPAAEIRDEYLRPAAEEAFECLRAAVREGARESYRDFCVHAADWTFEVDVSAAGRARRAALDEVSFAVAAYALAQGLPGYVLEMLDLGRRAAAADTGFGREAIASSPERLLDNWAASWRVPGRLDRFDGVADAAAAKRRLLVLLLARSYAREPEAFPAILAVPAEDVRRLVSACRDQGGDYEGTRVVSADQAQALEALEAVSRRLEGIAEPQAEDAARGRKEAGLTSRILRILGLGKP